MSRRVKRLTDLEIDEISLVDRAANQHAVMAFSKSDQEEQMPEFYDSDGDPIDTEDLETGDHILDADGNEYVYVSDEDADQLELDDSEPDYQVEDADDGEFVGVGKAKAPASHFFLGAAQRLQRPVSHFRGGLESGALARQGSIPLTGGPSTRSAKVGSFIGRSPGRAAAIGGTAVGVPLAGSGGLYAYNRKKKSDLGKSVYYELSKAMNDSDRDEVIAKAMDAVDTAYTEAAEARALAEDLANERVYEGYVSKAAEYDVPVSREDLGALLMPASKNFSKREMTTLETILQSSGADLSEYGTAGGGVPSEVLAQFEYLADEVVGKSDMTHAEAMTALFEANPAAYDAYLAETVR
jgi:hypothetical protein